MKDPTLKKLCTEVTNYMWPSAGLNQPQQQLNKLIYLEPSILMPDGQVQRVISTEEELVKILSGYVGAGSTFFRLEELKQGKIILWNYGNI